MEYTRQVSLTDFPDVEGLQNALETLSGRLAQPYLSRRSGTMHSDPVQELSSALDELNSRERELQAAIGISKFLLEQGKKMKERKEYYSLKTAELEDQIANLRNELKAERQGICVERDKNDALSQELSSLESQVSSLSSQNRILHEELSSKDSPPSRSSTSIDLSDIVSDLHSQNNQLRRIFHLDSNEALQKQCFFLENANNSLENRITDLEISLQKSKNDYEKQREKMENEGKMMRSMRIKGQEMQEEITTLQLKLKKVQGEVERMVSDEKVVGEGGKGSVGKGGIGRKHSRHMSLVHEIKRLEEGMEEGGQRVVRPFREESEEEDEEGTGEILGNTQDEELFVGSRPSISSPTRTLSLACLPVISLLSSPPFCSLTTLRQLDIPPIPNHCTACKKKRYSSIPTRPEPLEEYFLLVPLTQATQAVKLNSPHIDSICTVAPEVLYKQVNRENVPFQRVRGRQWHVWVENTLTAMYLEKVFESGGLDGKRVVELTQGVARRQTIMHFPVSSSNT